MTRAHKPLFMALGGIAVLAIGVLGVVTVASGSDDDEKFKEGKVQEPSDDANAVVDEDAGYELTVPDDWAFTVVGDDVSDIGSELFPDEPDKAAAMQQVVAVLPRAIIGVGVDGDEFGDTAYATNANVVVSPVPSDDLPSYDEFVGYLTDGVEAFGGKVGDDEPFAMLGGNGARIEFGMDALDSSGYLYAAVVDDQLWQFTAQTADLDENEDTFDTMAKSMRVIE